MADCEEALELEIPEDVRTIAAQEEEAEKEAASQAEDEES